MAANSTSFKKGHKSKGGRPVGTGRVGKLLEDLESDLPEIRNKVVEMAKAGDMTAIKLIWERAYPVSNYQMIQIEADMETLRELLEAASESN